MEPFGAAQLQALLSEVAEELRRAGHHGSVYVVGGSAMSLAGYSSARTTQDVDARIESGHGPVIAAVQVVGRRHGLPGSWLNEQATVYIPAGRDASARTVFSHPNLTVTAAAPERLLAMKLVAGRAQDVDDAKALAELCSADATVMRELVVELFGADQLKARTELTITLVADALADDPPQ